MNRLTRCCVSPKWLLMARSYRSLAAYRWAFPITPLPPGATCSLPSDKIFVHSPIVHAPTLARYLMEPFVARRRYRMRSSRRAIVCGGSIAGLLAARVLSSHCDEVIVL